MTTDKRFLVAISYAGEDRELVEPIAKALAAELGEDRVLYDRFHQAEFIRPKLHIYLLDLYANHSLLNVAVVGSNYSSKEWCGLEWEVFLDMIKRNETDRVMLLRADDGDVPGLLSTHGVARLNEHTSDELARLILERLNLIGALTNP